MPCSFAQSHLTVCNPMDCSPQTPLSMGFPGEEYWSGLSFCPGDLTDPGIEPASPLSPALVGGFFTTWEAIYIPLLGSFFPADHYRVLSRVPSALQWVLTSSLSYISVCVWVTQSCLTPCDPMNWGPPGSHDLRPIRLLHPWDSPGTNTGVGCIPLSISYT